MIVWALFDSGNGCYKEAVEKYPELQNKVEIYSIGLDIENKNNHFINLNLGDYSELFGNSQLFNELDKLPRPDVILASPPCESWSNASAMNQGNVCWYTEEISTLFGTEKVTNDFTIRTREQFEGWNNKNPYFKKHWWKTVFNRINGELCAFNTLRIIEHYQPKVWVIENPQSSKIWRYYKQIHGFFANENLAHYSVYDKNFSKKPTIFYSNIYLPLRTTSEKAEKVIGRDYYNRTEIRGYNERSNIPLRLIRDILMSCMHTLKNNNKRRNIK